MLLAFPALQSLDDVTVPQSDDADEAKAVDEPAPSEFSGTAVVFAVALTDLAGLTLPCDVLPKKAEAPAEPAKGKAAAAPAKKGATRAAAPFPWMCVCALGLVHALCGQCT